jgi:hypothetical protein
MKWLGFLSRTFSLGRILGYGSIVVAGAFAAGVWVGTEWEQGQQAQDTLEQQEDAQDEADRISEHQEDQAAEYERDRARREAAAREADRELDTFLESRPGLADCDIGPGGLRLIRRWDAAGTGGDLAEPTNAVPDAAAEPEKRRAAVSDAEPEGPH